MPDNHSLNTLTSNMQWLRDAAPYINAHRNCTFVIEFGGEALLAEQFSSLVHDIALLHSLGVKLVLVYGIRPQIDAKLQQQGIDSQFCNGLRITDDTSLPVVKEAAGSVRVDIEAQFSIGLANTPMAGSHINIASGNFVTAKPVGIHEGLDFAHTGEVRRINTSAISKQLDAGNIVLLGPVGYSITGEVFNLRAEDVATATATELCADKLIFMMPGEMLRNEQQQIIREMHAREAEVLLQNNNTLSDAVKLDINSALDACYRGVKRVHLLSLHQDGCLLQELYTRDGIGTLITADKYEDLRPAGIDDASGILELITPLEENGTLVRRSREQLELEIEHFEVMLRDDTIIGCAALYPYVEEKMGEVACIAIHPDYSKQGRGDILLKALEERARHLNLTTIFVLTTRTDHWFRERAYTPGNIAELPIKKRLLYNYQRSSKILFKEI